MPLSMYLHLGNDVAINTKDIVAILDLETSSLGKDTKALLAAMEKNHRVVNITEEMPKSAILAEVGARETLYISQLSTATLLLRSKVPLG